ncbi:MAG: prolyl oligopeptidase family serine peptidase, partial [Chitinophagaceae bacterium]
KEITDNKYDMDKLLGVDEHLNVLYFTAAFPAPMERTLFKVDLSTVKQTALTHKQGWHDVYFNQDFSYYIDNYSTINTPNTICLLNLKGDTLQVLSRNEELKKTIQNYHFQQGQFIKLPAANGIDSLNACILLPADFKKEKGKKYPVLFCNYGGPGSQIVRNSWGVFSAWHQMMAQRGYIIVSCDNRGTGFRGEYFQKCTYMQLGKLEIADQMSAAKSLSENQYYQIDTNRIGHWGWSYGGFLSSLAITRGREVFTAAVAIAPVTNFRYYDNIYTERYMRTPQENVSGYDENSPLHFVANVEGKLLLMHGTADDNVHYQNSAIFAESLVQHNKPFDFMAFTDKNHGIYGKNTSYFLWEKITFWLLENL